MFTSSVKRLITAIDILNEYVGRGASYLVLALVLLTAYDVAMRYAFHSGSVGLQELEWHLFALIFLLGAGYTLKHDGHVRVDVVYSAARLSERHRAWVNLIGTLLFLLPFCVLVMTATWQFVSDAYVFNEHSPDPGGLSHRWLLKAAIPLGFGLLLLQGIAEALRSWLLIAEPR